MSVNEKKWLVMHMHVQLQLDNNTLPAKAQGTYLQNSAATRCQHGKGEGGRPLPQCRLTARHVSFCYLSDMTALVWETERRCTTSADARSDLKGSMCLKVPFQACSIESIWIHVPYGACYIDLVTSAFQRLIDCTKICDKP